MKACLWNGAAPHVEGESVGGGVAEVEGVHVSIFSERI